MKDKPSEPVWPTDENWLEILEPALIKDPDRAEMAALLWRRLLEFVQEGKQGLRHASASLNDALRLTYPFTRSYRLAYQHWRLWLSSGDLPPADEPEQLLRDSIERVHAAIAKAKQQRSESEARSTKRRRIKPRPKKK
jgi:hypothetical protein